MSRLWHFFRKICQLPFPPSIWVAGVERSMSKPWCQSPNLMRRPTWNLITKKKLHSHDFGLKWFEILWMWWTIFLPYGCLFCGFLSSFFPWILLALIEKTKVQLFQTRFALLSNSFAVYKKKKNAFRGLKLAWAEKSVALLPAMQWWAWKPRR